MIPGMNPKQLKNMQRQMKKMGMEMKDLEGVKEVIIRFEDKEIIISFDESPSTPFTVPSSEVTVPSVVMFFVVLQGILAA